MAAEFDFDELDRAVNSVLGSTQAASDTATATSVPAAVPTADVTPPTPVALVTDVPPQPVDDSTTSVSVNTPKPSVVAPPVSAKPTTPTVPRPNSGRFMDMVHSSSEMKSPARETPANVVPAPPTSTPVPVVSSPAVPTPSAPTPPVVDMTMAPAGSPQDSPFVASTKIEKRPLGAFSDSASQDSGLAEHAALVLKPLSDDIKPDPLPEKPAPEPTEADDEPSQPAAEASSENTPLPEELQSAVLSLESDGPSVYGQPAEEPQAVVKPTSPAVPEKPVEPPKPVSPHEEILAKLPGSIAQQYREKAVTTAPASGAIFDTQDYHKPLAAKKPAKKKTPAWALYTLWGLALVVVGGGAGYAIYFYVLPLIQG